MNAWEKIANLIYVNYGGFVNWEERFFICPECGEPIYDCDWAAEDLLNGDNEFMCPICESEIQ